MIPASPPFARKPYPRGQALVEFLAIVLAVVPLVVLIPLLGRLQDQAHTTDMSSRHAAFEQALRAPLAQQAPVAGADGVVPVGTWLPVPEAQPFDSRLVSDLGLLSFGLFRAEVTRVVPNTPTGGRMWAPFDQLDLRISRQTTLLVGGWAAASPEQVDARVAPLAPAATQASAVLSPPIQAAGAFAELPGQPHGPAFGRLDLWRDVVPADRLRP